MSVGGKVIQIFKHVDKIWINIMEQLGSEPCSVLAKGIDYDIQLGDKIWWQGGKIYWTPKNNVGTFTLIKLGCSGVNHPLGKEYEITYSYKKIAEQRKIKLKEAIEILKYLVKSTPTDKEGKISNINNSAAYQANEYLKKYE